MSDETNPPIPEGLESVGGVLFPSDRAEEERRNLAEREEFLQKYGTPEGVAELEGRVQVAQKAVEEWKATNPAEDEYLEAIDMWKRGWFPVIPGDKEAAEKAELRMREMEKEWGIQYSDVEFIYNPEGELKEMGYSDEKIRLLHTLGEGRELEYALHSRQADFNRIRSLLNRR